MLNLQTMKLKLTTLVFLGLFLTFSCGEEKNYSPENCGTIFQENLSFTPCKSGDRKSVPSNEYTKLNIRLQDSGAYCEFVDLYYVCGYEPSVQVERKGSHIYITHSWKNPHDGIVADCYCDRNVSFLIKNLKAGKYTLSVLWERSDTPYFTGKLYLKHGKEIQFSLPKDF